MFRCKYLGSISLLALSAISGAPAFCETAATQASGGAQSANQADASANGTGEIVVTAQRRSERERDVPISIQNLSSEQLKDANVQSLAQIGSITPGLRFDNAGPFVQSTIRGVGTSVVTSGGGSNVGIYTDGFYSPNPTASDQQLLNVDSIQVLKGPQGTLFGRNTTGGAILVTTAKPSYETSGTFDASLASFDAARLQGYFTTGLTDKIAIDIAGQYGRGDGFIHNIVTGSNDDGRYKNWSVRAGIKIDFTSSISTLFRYSHEYSNDPYPELNGIALLNGQPFVTAPAGTIVATQPGQTAVTFPSSANSHGDVYQLTNSFDLGSALLTSYTQYRNEYSFFQQGFVAGTPNPGGEADNVPIHDTTFTQELLLNSKPGGRLQWTTGAFYFKYTDRYKAFVTSGGVPFYQVAGSDSDTRSLAVFADATYQLLNNLFVTAGVRYSHDEIRNPFYEALGLTGIYRTYAAPLNANPVTPRAVLRYQLDPKSNVYASFTKGYKPAIYNLGGESTDKVQPEHITAYEIGYKHGDRTLSVDLAGFYYNYRNLQVSSYNISGPVPLGVVSNAANARIYGAEAELSYRPTESLQFNAGGAYTNAKYQHFYGDPAYSLTSALSATTRGAINLSPLTDGANLPMQRAPKFTANLGARYLTPLAKGQLALSGTLYYSSKIYFDSAAQFAQTPFATLGLRAEWTDQSKRYTLSVYGDNVTNKRYYTQVNVIGSEAATSWSAPATVGGELKVRF